MLTILAQAATTKYHRVGDLDNKHFFLTVLEAGSLRSGCQHGQVLGSSSTKSHLPDVSLHEIHLFPFSFYKGTNPILEGPTLVTQLSPRGPISKYHHMGRGAVNALTNKSGGNYRPIVCSTYHCKRLQEYKDELDITPALKESSYVQACSYV